MAKYDPVWLFISTTASAPEFRIAASSLNFRNTSLASKFTYS